MPTAHRSAGLSLSKAPTRRPVFGQTPTYLNPSHSNFAPVKAIPPYATR